MADWRKKAISITPGDWRTKATAARPEQPEWLNEVESEEPERSPVADSVFALLSGGAKGALRGFDEEAQSLGGAVVEKVRGNPDSFGDVYRNERAANRASDKRIHDRAPGLYDAGQFGGSLLSDAATAIGTGGASLTPGGQAILGGLTQLGDSQADLTSGDLREYGKAALQTGGGAALSFGLSKGANKFGDWLEKGPVGKFLGGRVAKAEADAASSATGSIDDGIASLGGTYRQGVQQGSRYLENVGREMPNVSPQLQQAARELTATGAPQALRESVFENTLEAIPGQTSKIATDKAAFLAAQAGREQAIAAKTADNLADPFKRQILPRLKTDLSRAIPPLVGSTVGGALGGWPGAALGSVVGTGLAATMGARGTAWANAMRNPSVRKAGWELVQRALVEAPQRLGKFLPVLANATSPIVAHEILSQSDPEYQALQVDFLESAGMQP